jgi:hypothetical protein
MKQVSRTDFEIGTILYFEPFIFGGDFASKNKYFMVLGQCDEQIILASLPTSKDFIPSNLPKVHGCIDSQSINFNCYYLSAGTPVCKNGFCFPVDTYIYGYRLQLFDWRDFESQQSSGKTSIQIKGRLTNQELNAILKCLLESASVKRTYKRIIFAK